jgi:hypothetical protein
MPTPVTSAVIAPSHARDGAKAQTRRAAGRLAAVPGATGV